MVMSYDDKGREIEVSFCHESSVQPAIRFEQDEKGRRHAVEEGEIKLGRSEECGDDSFLAGKVTFSYDESGNMLEIATYAAGSSLPVGRVVMTYEGQAVYDKTVYKSGELLESKERIEREFDEHGNWVKETISSWVPSAGETEPGELEPTEIHHRTITYYSQSDGSRSEAVPGMRSRRNLSTKRHEQTRRRTTLDPWTWFRAVSCHLVDEFCSLHSSPITFEYY